MSNLYQATHPSSSRKDEEVHNLFQASRRVEQEKPTGPIILKQEDVHNLLQAHWYKKQHEPPKEHDHKPHNLYQARLYYLA
jgi:hypothetical protein